MNYLASKSNTQQEGAQNRVFGENESVFDEAGMFFFVVYLFPKYTFLIVLVYKFQL